MRGGFKSILPVLLTVITALVMQPLWAQVGECGEPVTLEEVVVTATLTEVRQEELGVSTTVITEEEIEKRGAKDVSELLMDVPGIHIARQGSRGGVTTLFPRGGESNFTLVLIDGVQVNEAGGFFDFSTLTTDNIEKIEIVRGPQSALYGSDAIGGVVHIFTKKGRGKPRLRVSTAHGAHSENGNYIGEQSVSISGGIPGPEGTEAREIGGYALAYGRIDDKGILDVNNEFSNNSFSGRVDLSPGDDLDLTLTARVQNSLLGIPTESGGDQPDEAYPGLDPNQSQENLELAGGIRARFAPLPWWENVVSLGIHRLDREFEDPPDPESAFDVSPGSRTDTLEGRMTFGYHLNLLFPQDGSFRSTLTMGYEYERESLDQESFSPFIGANEVSEDRVNHGFFFQEQAALWDRLYLTGGFRVEDNEAFGIDVNPRGSIALVFPETGTKLRGAVGTGIKEPTLIENFAILDFGFFGRTLGNPDLEPEKSFSWEVGVDQNLFKDRLMLGLTYFENRYRDLIDSITTAGVFPPTTTFVNIQKAESRGVELSARVKVGGGLSLGGSYTYLETEVTDDGGAPTLSFAEGEKLLRRPRHSASFFADWLKGGFHVRLDGTYVGERDDLFFQSLPAPPFFISERVVNEDYVLLDLAASYAFSDMRGCPLSGFKIFAKARNLLNEDYEEIVGFSSPGFNAMAGVEFAF